MEETAATTTATTNGKLPRGATRTTLQQQTEEIAELRRVLGTGTTAVGKDPSIGITVVNDR